MNYATEQEFARLMERFVSASEVARMQEDKEALSTIHMEMADLLQSVQNTTSSEDRR